MSRTGCSARPLSRGLHPVAFAETTIDQVYAREPYSSNGEPDTPNNSDGIYGEMGGTGLVRMSGSAAAG